MKTWALFINLFILLCIFGCQVKEQGAEGGLVSGHNSATNSFKLITPSSKTYKTGEVLSLQVTFPFPVSITGSPQLKLIVGSTTKYADYFSGDGLSTLTFKYTFVGTDNDFDGINVAALELNSGTIKFDNKGTETNCDATTLGSKTLTGVNVDNTDPTITAFSMTSLPGHYHLGQSFNFKFTFSETVYVTGTPRFVVTFSGTPTNISYTSGSGTNSLFFSYTIGDSVSDVNGFDSITSPLDLLYSLNNKREAY